MPVETFHVGDNVNVEGEGEGKATVIKAHPDGELFYVFMCVFMLKCRCNCCCSTTNVPNHFTQTLCFLVVTIYSPYVSPHSFCYINLFRIIYCSLSEN